MYPNIVIHPDLMRGKPTIKGTRITVEFIVSQFSEGRTMEYLLENYPMLTRETILEALSYAAHLLKHDETIYA